MRFRFTLPEPGLSRAARWCLGGSFLLILGFFFVAGIWLPVSRIAEVTGTNPRIEPPASAMAEWDDGDEDPMLLSMSGDARLWRRQALLDPADLEGALLEAILRHDRRCRMEGKVSLEEISDGVRASKLILLLRVDRAAPWGAVHDVMRRAGEQGVHRIGFLTRPPDAWASKWLWVWLPWKDAPRAAIGIRIRGGPGGSTVYSHADIDASDPAAFSERLRALCRESEDRGAGLIDAPRDTRFEAVVHAIDAFAAAGFWNVELDADDIRAEVR